MVIIFIGINVILELNAVILKKVGLNIMVKKGGFKYYGKD